MGALGERLGDVLGALESLLEASWKPLGGRLRATGSREASKEPPGTTWQRFLRVFTCFSSYLEEPGGPLGSPLEASGRRLSSTGERLGSLLEASWDLLGAGRSFKRLPGAAGGLFYVSGRPPGGLLEGLWKASWRPPGGSLAMKTTCFTWDYWLGA